MTTQQIRIVLEPLEAPCHRLFGDKSLSRVEVDLWKVMVETLPVLGPNWRMIPRQYGMTKTHG